MKHMNFIERFFFKAQISILNFCFYSYRHPNDKEFFDGILTLGDLLQREDENGDNVIRNYPPLFLACSRQDPLIIIITINFNVKCLYVMVFIRFMDYQYI